MTPYRTLLALLVLVSMPMARGGDVDKPITAAEREHWAFHPPARPAVPAVKTPAWVRNPIDAFILAALEQNDLAPAPEADRPTLLRRLTFDLTGLPPTPEELDAFLADTEPGAYERVVDRLLASPRYGERWAQHWLDLARYADTDGFEYDAVRPDAWRYRDWVVSALNDDMPYDRFLRLQLAGDEVAGEVVATGFIRCYADMVDLNDQKLRRQNALNDITDTTALVFLGLTVGCARCHDHKFDPIRQADFYRLQAFFTPARFRDDLPVIVNGDGSAQAETRRAWERRLYEVQSALVRGEEPVREALTPAPPPGLDDETVQALEKSADERTPNEVGRVQEAWAKDRRISPNVWPVMLGPWAQAGRTTLLAQLARLKATEPKLPRARGVDEAGVDAPKTFLLKRGELTQRGPEVAPAFPAVLRTTAEGPNPAIAPTPRSTGRRSALADWLVGPDHPLTARVIVNRLWQHHFGRGIVATSNDFGTMGAEPSHPELLDWLARELPARGWGLKEMHRLMVTSATYRQSSRAGKKAVENDPENELCSRYRRTRLDGEAIRDAMLAVSGTLTPAIGGPPVFPDLPGELARMRGVATLWPVSDRPRQKTRRSLYVFVRRNLRYPFFEAFDRPDSIASCPQRSVTTIAPQALTLLNSTLAHTAAAALAARVVRESGPDIDSRVRLAFRLAYGRDPDAAEAEIGRAFLDRDGTPGQLCLALINGNEFVYID